MKKIIFSFIALGLMTSCLKEEAFTETHETTPDFKVTATINDTETRTQLSEDFKVLWSAGDAISYFNNGKHYRFILEEGGEGKVSASFTFDAIDGKVYGGIETDITKDFHIGVYPFSENNKVSKSEDNIVISTVIPTSQEYAVNSFGQNASPMVAVNLYTPDFSFKNVGSMLIMPLKGEGVITKATLSSKSKKIAGAVSVTAAANDNWIPTVDVTAGDSTIVLTCVEGVTLSETATNFTFILAPGTYEANDLVIKFTDSYGNYFTTEITAENTFVRSQALIFGERTFKAEGVEELNLAVRAKSTAYTEAKRIIPTLEDNNIEEWVNNLMALENTKSVIQGALINISNGHYETAYNALGGIPGFKTDIKRFEATGSAIVKVGDKGIYDNMIDSLGTITNVETLIEYFEKYESVAQALGLQKQLNNSLDQFMAGLQAAVDSFNPDADDLEIEATDPLTAYKNKVKEQLESSIDGWDVAISVIETAHAGIPNPYFNPNKEESRLNFKWITKPDPSFMLTEYNQIKTYLTAANSFAEKFESLTTKEEIETEINKLPTITIDSKKLGVSREIKPTDWITGANTAFDDALENFNKEVQDDIMLIVETLQGYVDEFKNGNLVDNLKKMLEGESSIATEFILGYFNQNIDVIKDSLTNILEMTNNEDRVSATISMAITTAMANAAEEIDNTVAKTNANNIANLGNGAWSIFTKVLLSNKCYEIFKQYDLMDVYNALYSLTEYVEDLISYEYSVVDYYLPNIEDYQEKVDYWVYAQN